MNRFLIALMLSSALTAPVFAEGMAGDVACGTFMTMSHDDQMSAMSDAMASGDAMATDGTMSADDTMAALVAACTAHPDMMLTGAMHPAN